MVNDINVAVFATFAGIAITGIADFGGSLRAGRRGSPHEESHGIVRQLHSWETW